MLPLKLENALFIKSTKFNKCDVLLLYFQPFLKSVSHLNATNSALLPITQYHCGLSYDIKSIISLFYIICHVQITEPMKVHKVIFCLLQTNYLC